MNAHNRSLLLAAVTVSIAVLASLVFSVQPREMGIHRYVGETDEYYETLEDAVNGAVDGGYDTATITLTAEKKYGRISIYMELVWNVPIASCNRISGSSYVYFPLQRQSAHRMLWPSEDGVQSTHQKSGEHGNSSIQLTLRPLLLSRTSRHIWLKNYIPETTSNIMSQMLELSNLHFVMKDEYAKVRECAWDAFTDYPLFEYISGKGHGGMVAGIGYGIEAKCKKDDWIVVSDSEDFNGVAFFVPPNAKGAGTVKYILNGAVKILAKDGFGVIKRLGETERFADDVRKKVGGDDGWYLYGLMVRRDVQRRGISSSIIRPVLKHLDSIDARCYLETYKPKNVSIYEHLGFELKDTVTLPGTDLTLYSMLRSSLSERDAK